MLFKLLLYKINIHKIWLCSIFALTPSIVSAQAHTYFYLEHKPTQARLFSCSDLDGEAVTTVGNHVISDCAQWQRIPKENYFHLKNKQSQRHIRPDTRENNAPIVVQPNTWQGNWTQWSHTATDDGYGYLVNRATAKHVFLHHNGIGTPVQQQPSSWRGDYTRWAFIPVNTQQATYILSEQNVSLNPNRTCGTGQNNTFTEVSEAIGLNYIHDTEDYMFNQSGGVAAGDFDRDNWVDLYAVGGSNAPSVLLKNQGDGTFVNVAPLLGVNFQERNSGPSFGDANGDGYLDLFIGAVGGNDRELRNAENRLLINMQGQGFTDHSINAGVRVNGNTVSATWGDYDYDGDLDLFMAHWIRGVTWREGNHLWLNDAGMFSDVTSRAGLNVRAVFSPNSDSSFAGTFTDINGDNLVDLLIVSDSLGSQSYENNGDGTFTDTTKGNGIVSQFSDKSGMGSAVGDYDNDGDMDWFKSAIDQIRGQELSNHGNRLYENDGTGLFTDVTDAAGVRRGYWGWGACFGDFNNDGYLDIFHVNGMYPMEDDSIYDWDRFDDDPARLFINNGDKTFTESSEEMGVISRKQGRGVSCLDYDRDGDLDIMIANNGQSPDFFCNHGNQNNSVNIRLQQPGNNVYAIGAKIELTTTLAKQVREIRTGNNYLSQNPSEAHFGLGLADKITQLKVIWPDGKISNIEGAEINRQLIITRTD